MILISFFIDFIETCVFFVVCRRSKANLWLCMMSMCSALTALTAYFKECILVLSYNNLLGIDILYFSKINEFFYSFFHYIFWYTCLVFAINKSYLFSSLWIQYKKKTLILFSIVPIFSSIFISAYTENKKKIVFITIWATIYWLISNLLVYNTYHHIVSKEQKKLYFRILLYFCIKTTYIWLTNHILYAFYMVEYWNIINYIGIFHAFLFLYIFISYGLQVYKTDIYNSEIKIAIESMQISTSFINHFIKNEANKIALYVDIMNCSLQSNESLNMSHLNVIEQSSQNLLQMSQRINLSLNEVSIIIGQHRLKEIIPEVQSIVESYTYDKNINIENYWNKEQKILCDILHIKEVLINILKNSIEAIEHSGSIIIKGHKNDKHYILEIEDDGGGIPTENIRHVLKPFFTTKSRESSYGIGLTYCYNIMKKHNGCLDIFNNKKGGTTVLLEFLIYI